ncbi:hypothetical protein [Streptomyces sp. SAJ15]|uniref:hypothetical protein n=1 Tax=Streptomyces sp. SAJ15 TaxID=2011095 RepID=UPI00135D1E85|nr:hypothetical protein CD790_28095 [Streptomyces sp. SAJ15]
MFRQLADWITTAIEPWILRGALDLERTAHGVLPHRLPAAAREQIPDPSLGTANGRGDGAAGRCARYRILEA